MMRLMELAGATAADRRRFDARAAVLAVSLFLAVRGFVALVVGMVADEQGRSALRLYTKWDAQWYAGIAENGYGFVRHHDDGRFLADYAFFPLYPAAERFVSTLTGLSHPVAGVLLSVLASVVAAGGIFAVANRVLGAREAVVAVVLWAVVPVAVVQTMAYGSR
jgi:Gpi18-like mannosyltransferase